MNKFKVGDTVRLKQDWADESKGSIGVIERVDRNFMDWIPYAVRLETDYHWCSEEVLELINKQKINMSNKEKFLLAFKKEPEKSFRKAGITNGDDFLTDEGQSIFLSWLLKKHGEDFKKDVVDDLLKEEDGE